MEVLVTPADANCISSPELDSRIVEWLEQRGATPIDRDKLAESRASVQVTAHDGDGWTAIVEVR